MARAPKTGEEKTINPIEIRQGRAEFHLLGTAPMIYNAMSAKTMQTLLLPPKKKSTGEKATTLKHNPLQEYRDSMYRYRDSDKQPTRLMIPTTMPKSALSDVAKRVPGAHKAEVRQLCYVEGVTVDVYGIPQLFMKPVKSADMSHTPDIRTRGILPTWYCKIAIRYVMPQINVEAVGTLLAAAGVLNGLGDWRLQKGGAFGGFELVKPDDPRVKALIKNGSRREQDRAIIDPVYYDQETEDLYNWFTAEARRRDFKVVA